MLSGHVTARRRLIPCQGSLCQRIRPCADLLSTDNLEERVDWVPGHAAGRGNEAARACASA